MASIAPTTPPPASGKNTPPPKPRETPRLQGDLARVKKRLMEIFTTLSSVQGGLGLMTGDPRHLAGSDATATLAEPVVDAWIKVAQENRQIKDVLLRLTTGGVWGEVILVTAALGYTQAQIYGVAPAGLPNPWAKPEWVAHWGTAPPDMEEDDPPLSDEDIEALRRNTAPGAQG